MRGILTIDIERKIVKDGYSGRVIGHLEHTDTTFRNDPSEVLGNNGPVGSYAPPRIEMRLNLVLNDWPPHFNPAPIDSESIPVLEPPEPPTPPRKPNPSREREPRRFGR